EDQVDRHSTVNKCELWRKHVNVVVCEIIGWYPMPVEVGPGGVLERNGNSPQRGVHAASVQVPQDLLGVRVDLDVDSVREALADGRIVGDRVVVRVSNETEVARGQEPTHGGERTAGRSVDLVRSLDHV